MANALFADGAAAMVILAGRRRRDPSAFSIIADGSTLLPDCEDAMSWRIGDHGFTMTLSQRVPELIGEHVRPWLSGWLARHGLTDRIDRLVGGASGRSRILSVFGEADGPRAVGPFAVIPRAGRTREHVVADRRDSFSSTCATAGTAAVRGDRRSGRGWPSRRPCWAECPSRSPKADRATISRPLRFRISDRNSGSAIATVALA